MDPARAAREAKGSQAQGGDPELALWAQSAPAYSELSEFTLYQLSNQVLVNGACLEPGMEVVDLGCGTGATTLAAFGRQPDLQHVWAIDEVSEMLDSARQALRGRPVTFVHAAAASFSGALGGRRVDRVISNAAFFHFNDRQRVLAEIRSVLRPEGFFGLTLPGPNDGLGRFDLMEAVTARLHPDRPTPPRRAETFSRPRRIRRVACTYQSVRQILAQASFEVLSSEFFGYRQSPEEIVRWMLLPVFLPAEWEGFGVEALREALLDVLAARPSAPTYSWNLILARSGQPR